MAATCCGPSTQLFYLGPRQPPPPPVPHADLFSFPVTSPSEQSAPPEPAPIFGSWRSLKSHLNLRSPDDNRGEQGAVLLAGQPYSHEDWSGAAEGAGVAW